jgi:hypothetical protein
MKTSIDQFKKEGYYHGQSHFNKTLIEQLHNEFNQHFEDKIKRFNDRFKGNQTNYGANHDINRWNMLLPSESLLLSSGFYAEPAIMEILNKVFNTDFSLVFFSSDIAAPGSKFQQIHQDGNDFAVALNIPLIDSDEVNGATHVYPKTHLVNEDSEFTNDSNEFSDEEIIERSSYIKPYSLNVSKGDFTLRDLRLIHRGAPNDSDEIRPYLSAIYLPVENNEAPMFETIEKGLEVFQQFKMEAFPTGRVDLIDYANTFGRLVMGMSNSDRVQRPISKHISDQLSEDALYCVRFAKFEDSTLNNKIVRTKESSQALENEISNALNEFEALKNSLRNTVG